MVLANQDTIFVSYDYRTSGWLAIPELSAESPRSVSGNYGLLNEIEILKWIKENTAEFGGSQTNHHCRPLAKRFIVGAIAESGIKDLYDLDLPNYELRSMINDELLNGADVTTLGAGFDPVLDGWAIPTTCQGSLDDGLANDVPVLAGNDRDEDGVTFDANYTVSEHRNDKVPHYNTTRADNLFQLCPANNTAKATTAY